MLKLYYASNAAIEIGEYHARYDTFIGLLNDNPRETGEYPDLSFNITDIIASGGSGFKAAYDALGTSKALLYRDAELTKPTSLVIHFPFWSNYTAEFRLYYRDGKGDDFLIDSFLIPKDKLDNCQLRSWFCTTGNDLPLSFAYNMLDFEKGRIGATEYTNVINAAYSPLTSIMVPCWTDALKVYCRPLNGYQATPACSYINAASVYYMLTGKRIVNPDNFVNDNVEFTPGFVYDPRAVVLGNQVRYKYESAKVLTFHNETSPFESAYVPGANKRSIMSFPYVQIPERIYTYTYTNFNNGEYQALFNISLDHGYYDSVIMYSGTSDNIGVNQHFDINAQGETHTMNIIQLKQKGNLSKLVSEDPESTEYSDISEYQIYKLPGYAIAATNRKSDNPTEIYNCSPVMTIIYLYGDNVGNFTNNDLFEWAFNSTVQESKDPEQYPEHKDQEDPEGQPTGGFTDNTSDGGDGTWSDTNDDTAIDPDGDPATDPVAPMPSDLGLTGNVNLVRIDAAGLESLADQAWQDEGFMKHMTQIMGRSRIGDGVQEVKTFMLNLPVTEAFTVDNVAGYELQSAVTGYKVNRYHQFNFGTISIPKYFDNFLDFSATQFTMMLPFGGSVTLNAEDLVGKDITVILRVDAFDGTGLYYIQNNTKNIMAVPAQLTVSVPFSTSEYTMSGRQFMVDSIQTVANAAGRAVSSSAGAGLSAINAAAELTSEVFNQEDNRPIQCNPGGAPSDVGVMGPKNIILYVSRPYVTIPEGYYQTHGCTSNYIVTIGDCKGYFEINKFMGQLSCTDAEANEIIDLLKAGVLP